MIKIIKEGEVPKAQIECYNCHSILEYGNGDLRKYHVDFNTLTNALSSWEITCPVCSCKIKVSWIKE